jgi:hypothetical protein
MTDLIKVSTGFMASNAASSSSIVSLSFEYAVLHMWLDFEETKCSFLVFGLPLTVITSMLENQVMAGCVFSVLSMFIVSGTQPGYPVKLVITIIIDIVRKVLASGLFMNVALLTMYAVLVSDL